MLQPQRLATESSNNLLLLDFKSFHTLLWVLFSFPSRYYCAIGLWLYLGLAVNPAVFRPPIQGALLFKQLHIDLVYGTITL